MQARHEPTHLDLFSGIGGFALAAQWAGFRTVGFCEIDKYCQKVLAKNFLSQPDAIRCNGRQNDQREAATERARPSISSNIFDLDGRDFAAVSLITGGFPCQPFSVAGERRGAADDRAIWPEMFRVIDEARPAWVLAENVPGIIAMELDNVLSDLEGIGYATGTLLVPACAVDAKHRRDRVWVIGRNVSDSSRELLDGSRRARGRRNKPSDGGGSVSDPDIKGLEGQREIASGAGQELHDPGDYCRWEPESGVGRNFNGLSRWLDESGLNEIAKTRADQILRDVWCDDVAQAFQREVRRFNGVSETEILLTFLCEYEEQSNSGWTQMESRTVALGILRNLWRNIESSRSPYRRQYRKQLAIEYSNALRKLPLETSSLYPQAWANGCWEDGMPRVANGIKNRVDRLKGLGNSVVVPLVYEILREIRKLC